MDLASRLTHPLDVLAVNSGSSSLKLRLISGEDRVIGGGDLSAGDRGGLSGLLDELPPFDAVAHRFVHGGRLGDHALLDERALQEISEATVIAPLHTELAIACARELLRLRPALPQVACLDTAFHRSLPEAAAAYAIPREWRERHGVRRSGFHGLSYASASRRAAELLSRPIADLRVVVCHLGAGASLAAVAGGCSVDTTMGMTPNEGLVMATRSGSVDPGALLLLAERAGGPAAVREALEHRSGLLGLSERSGDMRDVLDAADEGDGHARLALDVYLHRLRAGIAAMAAAMGGVDAIVFTAGVGENAPRVRAGVCEGLEFLGVELDAARNKEAAGDVRIDAGARTAVFVVTAREELQMAAETRALLDRG